MVKSKNNREDGKAGRRQEMFFKLFFLPLSRLPGKISWQQASDNCLPDFYLLNDYLISYT